MLHNFHTIFRPAASKQTRIRRCENAQAAFDPAGAGPLGPTTGSSSPLPAKNRENPGGHLDASRSLAHHRKDARFENIHGSSLRRGLYELFPDGDFSQTLLGGAASAGLLAQAGGQTSGKRPRALALIGDRYS